MGLLEVVMKDLSLCLGHNWKGFASRCCRGDRCGMRPQLFPAFSLTKEKKAHCARKLQLTRKHVVVPWLKHTSERTIAGGESL